mmetsp:Transcript_25885/g.56395  ORF Transcript_25885/g.56395 Transcript_25885/m.56395 type:complete len:279 (-) Transcript_25885:735-1571(-)
MSGQVIVAGFTSGRYTLNYLISLHAELRAGQLNVRGDATTTCLSDSHRLGLPLPLPLLPLLLLPADLPLHSLEDREEDRAADAGLQHTRACPRQQACSPALRDHLLEGRRHGRAAVALHLGLDDVQGGGAQAGNGAGSAAQRQMAPARCLLLPLPLALLLLLGGEQGLQLAKQHELERSLGHISHQGGSEPRVQGGQAASPHQAARRVSHGAVRVGLHPVLKAVHGHADEGGAQGRRGGRHAMSQHVSPAPPPFLLHHAPARLVNAEVDAGCGQHAGC